MIEAPNAFLLVPFPTSCHQSPSSLASGGDNTPGVLVWSGSWRRRNHPEADSRMEESGGLCLETDSPRPRERHWTHLAPGRRRGGWGCKPPSWPAADCPENKPEGRCFATPQLEKGSSHFLHLLQLLLLLLLHLTQPRRGRGFWFPDLNDWVPHTFPGRKQSLTPR